MGNNFTILIRARYGGDTLGGTLLDNNDVTKADGIRIYLTSGAQLRVTMNFTLSDQPEDRVGTAANDIMTQSFNNLIVTFNGTTTTLYQNATQVGQGTTHSGRSVTSTDNINIGKRVSDSDFPSPRFLDAQCVRFIDRALTSQEVSDLSDEISALYTEE
jgi:hypothetical protein